MDNQNGSIIHSTTNSINSSNSSLNCEKFTNGNGLAALIYPQALKSGGLNKRNSIDSTLGYQMLGGIDLRKTFNQSISESPAMALNGKLKQDLDLQNEFILNHRRSLSENVITFPPHTTPSDKARCHQLNRTNSRLNAEAIAEVATIYSNLTLRKVAETMFLKDPQYKPRPKEDSSKPNPFAALAQLRGVKKILGANATTYTPGAGDLFSSCFEMSSPFLKDLNEFNGRKTVSNTSNSLQCLHQHQQQPKSLPSSPIVARKEFKFEPTAGSILGECEKCEAGEMRGACNGKKYRASFSELSSHPLYKNGKTETDPKKPATTVEAGITPKITTTITSSGTHSYSKLVDKIEAVEMPTLQPMPFYETPRLLTRRGSTESGFFSCLNEDFGATTPVDFGTVPPCCNCCRMFGTASKNEQDFGADSSGVLDDASIRSMDDLEFEKRFNCPHRYHQLPVDIDARSIDMGLINRLALDSEINSLLMQQKSQFSNQLLYCKNRTSSIFTDSSDDISSLAGSDSLLWDDYRCSYSSIPNQRSAQIAKIVEYFERKGNFKQFSSSSSSAFVPDSMKQHHSSFIGANRQPYNFPSPTPSSYHHHKQLTDYFVDLRRDFNLNNGPATNGSSSTIMSRDSRERSRSEYDTFCMELDKKSPQNFHKICEGLVKSKLQLFDKLKQTNNQPEK